MNNYNDWMRRKKLKNQTKETKKKCPKSFRTELHAKNNKYANEHVNIVVHETVKIGDALKKLKTQKREEEEEKNKVNTHRHKFVLLLLTCVYGIFFWLTQ